MLRLVVIPQPVQVHTAVQAVYDAKSEEIGPGIYRFKAEIGQSYSAFLQSR